MKDMPRDTRVLLIDDLTMIREGLRNMFLSRKGILVAGEEADVKKGLKLAAELHPDIVIIGVSGPNADCIASIREIVGSLPGTRVIVILRNLRRDFLEDVLRSGASAYLAKDSPFDEMDRALQTVIRGHTYITPLIAGVVIDGYITQQTGQTVSHSLTDREIEVLKAICEGESMREIASRLAVSVKTVETHRRRMMEKLNFFHVADLIKYAIREGITSV
ncbi:MAG: response regulator transcription factor [Thermodesulfobacteriota bacterium]